MRERLLGHFLALGRRSSFRLSFAYYPPPPLKRFPRIIFIFLTKDKRRLEHPELREFFVEQPSMNSEPASGVPLVAVGCFQRLLDEMTLPTPDRLMKWKSRCCLDIEYARCWGPRSGQFLLHLFGCYGSSAGSDGGALDQVLQFPHVAWERIALQCQYGIYGKSGCCGLIPLSSSELWVKSFTNILIVVNSGIVASRGQQRPLVRPGEIPWHLFLGL